MIPRLITTGLGLIGGAFLMIAIVHPGIGLLRLLLGKDRCFGSDALNGCSTWGNGTILCAVVAFLMWPWFGFASLLFVPLVPLLAMLFWTAYFCLKAATVRRREFTVQDGVILRQGDGKRIEPEFVISCGWHSQTGPGTAYTASVLQLGERAGGSATNVYVDDELAERVLAEVMRIAGPHGCRLLDVSFVVHIEPRKWHVVRLNSAWTPLLCGPLEKLTATDRAWWRQWCQPEFGSVGRTTVHSQSVSQNLERLVAAYPWLTERHPEDGPDHDNMPMLSLLMGTVRTRDNVRALQSLLARHATVEIVTSRAHRAELDQARGERGGVGHSFDEAGIEVQEVQIFG